MPYFKSFTPDFEPYQYPKRPRITYEDDYSDFINPDFSNGLVPNPQMPSPEFLPELAIPLIPPATQPVYNLYGSADDEDSCMKGNGNGNANVRTLSVQSIAARERRRKITDKTQELGKLVPGGHKFNTAEMFEAAYKYIKFLKPKWGFLSLWEQKNVDREPFRERSYDGNGNRNSRNVNPGGKGQGINWQGNYQRTLQGRKRRRNQQGNVEKPKVQGQAYALASYEIQDTYGVIEGTIIVF
ncbi:hypothetical protein RJ639_042695 [Escallonia herrerae]|uniref:BHLH domain-containing protein n=1 Tax=Escallonia herrerae TaxID=1293975 RepID=A0AA88WCN7_9ASTE|nr:hypothetical protein RJ639_042695 [Escallonia herrerae]